MRSVFEMNIGKLGTRKKLKFLFWVEGSVGGCGRVLGSRLDQGAGCGGPE